MTITNCIAYIGHYAFMNSLKLTNLTLFPAVLPALEILRSAPDGA